MPNETHVHQRLSERGWTGNPDTLRFCLCGRAFWIGPLEGDGGEWFVAQPVEEAR